MPTEAETSELFSREFRAITYTVTPATALSSTLALSRSIFLPQLPMARVLANFAFMTWDSISVRITFSSPKSLIGAIAGSAIPFNVTDFATATLAGFSIAAEIQSMTKHAFVVPFGTSQDVELNLPWSFRTPVIPTKYLTHNPVSDRMMPGDYVLVLRDLAAVSVVDLTNPACDIIVFVKYNGVKMFGPVDVPMIAQSAVLGNILSSAAIHAASKAVPDAIEFATSTACEYTGMCTSSQAKAAASTLSQMANDYITPTAMLPSPYGDFPGSSTSTGIRHNNSPDRIFETDSQKHSFMEFLSRPTLLQTVTSSDVVNRFTNDISSFSATRNRAQATWFSYFGQMARYWTGSIDLYFVVCGHPMIEVDFRAALGYAYDEGSFTTVPSLVTTNATFSSYKNYNSVFSGSRVIKVTLPHLASRECTPVKLNPTGRTLPATAYATTFLDVRLITRSSAIGPLVNVPYVVYVAAGPDFQFLDPRPPVSYLRPQASLYPTENMGELIPGSSHSPTITHLQPLIYLEDVADLWSRFRGSGESQLIYPAMDLVTNTSTTAAVSWNDIVSFISRPFLCFSGDISYKVITDRELPVNVALSYADPVPARNVSRAVANDSTVIPPFCDPAKGTVLTTTGLQPMLEFHATYRGVNTLSFVCSRLDELPVNHNNTENAPLDSNLFMTTAQADIVYRKAGSNFRLHYETCLPDENYWMPDDNYMNYN